MTVHADRRTGRGEWLSHAVLPLRTLLLLAVILATAHAAETPATSKKPQATKPKAKKQKAKKPKPKKSPWQFHPTLDLSCAYDGTVIPRHGGSRDAVSTWRTSVAPGFALSHRVGTTRSALTYSFVTRSYTDVDERDSTSHRVRLSHSRRLSAKWGLRISDYATYVQDTGGENDEAISALTTYIYNRARVTADYALAPRWKLLLGLAHSVRDYQESIYRDSNTIAPSWGLQWRPNKRDRWQLNHEFKHHDVDRQEIVQTHRLLAGYATALPWKVYLDAQLGVLWFQNTGSTYPAGRVVLRRAWGRARLSLRCERSSSVTSYYGATRRDYVSLRPQYKLDKNTDLIGRVSLVLSESVEDDRIDTSTWRYGLTLRRRLTRWLTGDVGYTYVDQNARGISGYDIHGPIALAGLHARF